MTLKFHVTATFQLEYNRSEPTAAEISEDVQTTIHAAFGYTKVTVAVEEVL